MSRQIRLFPGLLITRVIVLIAGLSATMSSASTDAIAAVSLLFRDVHIMEA